jgi:hypothetical protein
MKRRTRRPGANRAIKQRAYNGQFPGPLLRLREGQQVVVDIHKQSLNAFAEKIRHLFPTWNCDDELDPFAQIFDGVAFGVDGRTATAASASSWKR